VENRHVNGELGRGERGFGTEEFFARAWNKRVSKTPREIYCIRENRGNGKTWMKAKIAPNSEKQTVTCILKRIAPLVR